ncbi:hypothetical protein, partial [Kosakonia cowanii]|uniref:hypothetical protein n=1 Tax=Kosakonia cowanii TaxID=208223 RepID=UPI0028AE6617
LSGTALVGPISAAPSGSTNPTSLSDIAPSGGAFVNLLLFFGAYVAQKLCIRRFSSSEALLFPPLLAKNKHL